MSGFKQPIYAVVLAGGSGTRFWPKSRHHSPKQLCAIGDSERTMIEHTLLRLEGFIPPAQRLIVTHAAQAAKTAEIVGSLCPNIISEPCAKNTAAALAMAACEIRLQAPKDSQPVMISLHADHVIKDVTAFTNCLRKAVEVASIDKLCLIGISPTYPETGYGYIEKGEQLDHLSGAFCVASFREKPNRLLAEQYVNSNNFLWNSGIFVWKVDTLLEEFSKYLPQTIHRLDEVAHGYSSFRAISENVLADCYRELEEIAIDHAILEKSKRVAVIDGRFGWQDIGSWAALRETFPVNELGNLTFGDNYLIDCQNMTVDSDGPFIAAIGVKDLVIVSAKGAVLVCPHDKAQDVKHVVSYLKSKGRSELI